MIQTDGKRLQQFRRLTEVSRALTYAVSLDEVLRLTVERAAELLEAEKSVLMLNNADGLLTVHAAHGLSPEVAVRFREPLNETLIHQLQALLDVKPAEFLGVPLVVGGEVTGLLAVARPRQEESVEENEWLLSALADQAAVALEKTRLDESAEFRERLIGIVSHDLRNPISTILMGLTVLLERDQLDERTTRTLSLIHASAERASRMVRDLLDYTEARLGGIRVEKKPADLHDIVRHLVEEMEVAYPGRRIEVRQEGGAGGTWDGDRLAQVVGNLLTNALHYSPEDTAVRVETGGDEGWVRLTVHNQGEPIPAERLSHVFEPMQRATTEVDMAGRSVGLGLYIVRHLVQAHGGTVAVRSTAAEGTTFTVRLPRTAVG